jgi:hypothetical protein
MRPTRPQPTTASPSCLFAIPTSLIPSRLFRDVLACLRHVRGFADGGWRPGERDMIFDIADAAGFEKTCEKARAGARPARANLERRSGSDWPI